MSDEQDLEAGMMRRIDAIMRGGPAADAEDGDPPPGDAVAVTAGATVLPAPAADAGRGGRARIRLLVGSSLAVAVIAGCAILSLDLWPSRPDDRAPEAVVQPLPPVAPPSPQVSAPAPPATVPAVRTDPVPGLRVRTASRLRRHPERRPRLAHARVSPATRRAGGPAVAVAEAAPSAEGPREIQTPHLTGEAKRKALADDAILTRRLNRQVLSRGGVLVQPPPADGRRDR